MADNQDSLFKLLKGALSHCLLLIVNIDRI